MLGIVFLTISILLMVSILKTIGTNPGSIPEDKEWDMPSDTTLEVTSSEEESDKPNEKE